MLQFQEKRNVIKKEAEKILKHKDLTVEIQCTWDVKINVIPVIIGEKLEPSQNHSKNTRATYRENTKSRNYTNIAISGTAHILRQVLM